MGTTTETYVLAGNPAGFLRAVNQGRQALGKFTAGIGTSVKNITTNALPAIGQLGTAVALVGGLAIGSASEFDAAMRSVQAKTNATGKQLETLTAQAREMGRTTVHSATQAARGQAFLAQAGFDANEVLQALPATLALATAGELDLAVAADITSNVLQGFRLETSQTARVADVLALAAASTNTSVEQMGAAMAKAAPSAAAAGWSIEQTAAAIGRLSDAGIQGEEAGTALKTMMARLATATPALRNKLDELGISIYNSDGNLRSINEIIGELEPHANDLSLQFELLGTRGGNAGLILSALGEEDLDALTRRFENAEGATQRMADTMGGGLWGAIKAILSIVESARISFGNRLAPAIETVRDIFAAMPGPIQEVIVIGGGLVGTLGLITVAFGTAWTAALGPLALVVAGIAAVGAVVYGLMEGYKALNPSVEDVRATLEEQRGELERVNAKIDEYREAEEEVPPALIAHREELESLIEKMSEYERLKHAEAIAETREVLLDLEGRYASLNERIEESYREFGHANQTQLRYRDELQAQIETTRALLVEMGALRDESISLSDATDEATESTEDNVEANEEAAAKIQKLEDKKRLAVVQHLQKRRQAERAAAEDVEELEDRKRRAVVEHLQRRGEAERDAAEDAARLAAEDAREVERIEQDKQLAIIRHVQHRRERQAQIEQASADEAVQVWEQALDQWSNAFSRAFEGGGNFLGGFASQINAEITGFFKNNKLLAGMGKFGGMLGGLLSGGLTSAVSAGLGWLSSKIAGWWKAEEKRINDISDSMIESFDALAAGTITAAEAWDKAVNWQGNEEGFEALRTAQQLWRDAGLSAEEATEWSRRYNEAVKAGNTVAMRALLEERQAVGELARERATLNETIDDAASFYRSAQAAAEDEGEAAKTAALEAGASRKEAERIGREAAAAAYEERKRLRIQEMAEEAAFAAALAEIKKGNAAGAAAAARAAYEETRQAATFAFDAVEQAAEAASEGIAETFEDNKAAVELFVAETNKTLSEIRPPTIDIHYRHHPGDVPDFGGGTNVDFGGFQARGGFYEVDRPTLFVAGEAGREQAAFSGAGRGFGSSGSDMAEVLSVLTDIRDLARQNPETAAHAMAEAIQVYSD